jgi:hypothetical protein
MSQRKINTIDGSSIAEEGSRDTAMEEAAYCLVDSHPHFRRRAELFTFRCDGGVLTVQGAVTTFYLKQVLQSTLLALPGICGIDNRVTVLSCEGLCSSSRG